MPVDVKGSIADSELLSRYIVSSKWLNKSDPKNPRLKPEAFIAHPTIEMSVFRVGGWTQDKLKAKGLEVADERERKHKEKELAAGRNYPEGKRSINLYGAGIISALGVRETGLDVKPNEPPERHAVIVGWPPLVGDRKKDESAQLVYALKLVSKAKFQVINV